MKNISKTNRTEKDFLLRSAMAAALNLVIEIMNRGSLLEAIIFVLNKPLVYLSGALVILVTLCVSLFTRKRGFWMSVITVIWLLLGLTNCVILALRSTPFSAVDISLALSCFPVITMYLKIWQIVLIAAAACGLIAFTVVRFIKTAPVKPDFAGAAKNTGITAAAAAAVLTVCFLTGSLSTEFPNLPDAYEDYGFTYCFSVSVFDKGIDRPKDYGEEEINDIGKEVAETGTEEDAAVLAQTGGRQPNIIILQLESFVDPKRLNGLTFSEDPVPVFGSLKEEYMSGYLTVPSIGAGTANTEFEVLTGMSLNYFGAGEYPYKTVLLDKTCESIPYNLDPLGYVSTAIHNNNASFYGRDEVFANLGFDRFESLEFMNGVSYNPIGWAKDAVLTDVIMDALTSTEETDFLFTISVQPHGKYPESGASSGQTIAVTGPDDEAETAQYAYYVNQIREVDEFLGQLISRLGDYPEPVMLVLYGDHLPSFEYETEVLNDGTDLFKTEYVIWSNFALPREDRDLYTWQLGAETLGLAGIREGVITRLHQGRENDPEYEAYLEMLEYDMLYGKQIIWNGVNPYEPKQLVLGIRPVTVSGYEYTGAGLIVRGSGFTPYTAVIVDGKTQDTELLDAHTLLVRGLLTDEDDEKTDITAAVVDKHGKVLRRAEPY